MCLQVHVYMYIMHILWQVCALMIVASMEVPSPTYAYIHYNCTHPPHLISSPAGVVSLSPNEAGIIPLKASCHSPPPPPSTSTSSPSPSSTSASHSTNSSRSLCFSDVPLGTTTVSVLFALPTVQRFKPIMKAKYMRNGKVLHDAKMIILQHSDVCRCIPCKRIIGRKYEHKRIE